MPNENQPNDDGAVTLILTYPSMGFPLKKMQYWPSQNLEASAVDEFAIMLDSI